MRVAMMTREYPPEVYGGARVHVTELVAQLRRLCQVDVHCMGAPQDTAFAHQPDPALADANPALSTLSTDLRMAQAASTPERPRRWSIRIPGTRNGRSYHLAAARDSARGDRAFTPRTQTTVEGRTARRRLSDLAVGQAHRDAGGRRGDRREQRHALPTCWKPTRPSIRRGSTW